MYICTSLIPRIIFFFTNMTRLFDSYDKYNILFPMPRGMTESVTLNIVDGMS